MVIMAYFTGFEKYNTVRRIDMMIMSRYNLRDLAILDNLVIESTEKFYAGVHMQRIISPEIVRVIGACENVETLFGILSKRVSHRFMTQTSQLTLELCLQYFDGVYSIVQSGRDENADARHLDEFVLLEGEFSIHHPRVYMNTFDQNTLFISLLSHIETLIKCILKHVLAYKGELPIDGAYLAHVLEKPFRRVDYQHAIEVLQHHGLSIGNGVDFSAESEQMLLQLIQEENKEVYPLPIFLIRFPGDIKFFNMREDEQHPEYVMNADLILPYAGESASSSLRENRYDVLLRRLREKTLMFKDLSELGLGEGEFSWYLKLVEEQKLPIHAGYGIGMQRLTQFLCASSDIRESSFLYSVKSIMGI